MKKIYSLALLLTMLVCTGLSASAYELKFEWDEPGSVRIQTGSLTGPFVELAADQTSYTYEATAAAYVYVYANGDYFLQSLTLPDNTVKKPVASYSTGEFYAGGFWNTSNMEKWAGAAIKVNVTKIDRSSEFTFDVVNGLDCFTAKFTGSGYEPALVKGANTVKYDPAVDTNLQINYVNGSVAGNPSPALYSVTYDGVAVEKAKYYERWEIPAVEPGKTVTVQTYESDEPIVNECVLSLDFPAGMEDCINTIRDWTLSKFITPDADNKITVKEGTDLSLNFKADYTVTDILLNGTSLADAAKVKTDTQWRFIVNEGGVLQIVGTAKDYGKVTFTAYIMNPEGVVLTEGVYGSDNTVDLTAGDAVNSDIAIDGNTLTAAASRKFTFEVDGKNPRVFISPKEGWYIATAQAKDGAKFEPINSADENSTTFYVIASKLEGEYSAIFDVTGDNALKLSGNATLSSSWDNPVSTFSLKAGKQDVSFIPGYDLPLSLRPLEGSSKFQVYLDGKVLALDEESGAATITPYYPANANDPQVKSTVVVYADGTTTGKVGNINLKASGVAAKMYYSAIRHDGGTSVDLLYGTPVYIVPASVDCLIKVGNKVVHGIDAEGNTINGLNEAGEYVMDVNATRTTVTVSAQATFDITGITPADGATVNSIKEVKVVVPMVDETGEHMTYTSEENVAKISLTREGAEAIYASSLGEPSFDEATGGFLFPINFPEVTENGEYTLTIPAGTFFEAEWDDAVGAFVDVDGGAISKALTAKYTVDANAKSAIDVYTLTPASGSALKSLRVVYLTMPEYGPYDMVEIADPTEGSFTNGTTTYNVMIGYDWENTETRGFMIIPCTDSYEEMTITEDGEWTLSLAAGTFSFNDESSSAIEAKFNISASNPAYPVTPATGSVTGKLNKFTIDFVGAVETEYNDTAITLKGDDNDYVASTTYVSGKNPYTIQFTQLPSEAGEYTLTIPAGAFTIDGQANEEVVAHYTYKPIYELTPAGMSTVENLDEITLTFPEAAKAEFVGDELSFVLTVGGSYAAPGFECTRVNDNTFKLTLPEGAQTVPTGTAIFRIEEGTFTIDGEASPEIRTTYTVARSLDTSWSATPENTIVYADYGFYWAFVFDESAQISYPDASKIHVNFCGEDLAANSYEVMPEGNYLMMQITDAALIKEGKLNVSIEAGAFNISGTPNDAIEYSWDVVAPKDYTSTVVPSNDKVVNDLSTITISFPEAKTAELYNEYGISLMKSDYSYNCRPATAEVAGAEYPTFELTFDPAPITLGSYTFTSRIGSFTLDGSQESPEIKLVYNFDKNSGVWNIGIDSDSTVTIVTIDGRVIAKDAPASELEKLAKGNVYIINGVKVFIK